MLKTRTAFFLAFSFFAFIFALLAKCDLRMKIALKFVESGRWRFNVFVFRPSTSWIAWKSQFWVRS